MLHRQYFNSQPHEEADGAVAGESDSESDISTHSLTKRLTTAQSPQGSHLKHFNSQPHEEADRSAAVQELGQDHFNSQPHEEADINALPVELARTYFNSQPHEEADVRNLKTFITCVEFQLTASRRG